MFEKTKYKYSRAHDSYYTTTDNKKGRCKPSKYTRMTLHLVGIVEYYIILNDTNVIQIVYLIITLLSDL
jgi:hypothetical protein